MKILRFEDDEKDEWLNFRKGKITGSRLKDIISKRQGTGYKLGFYELIAERIATEPESGESPMDRGTRLEPEARAKFAKKFKKKVDGSLVLWMRDDNESIALSPDGIISDTEAVEIKCLSSARHIEAWLTQEIPDEYEYQVIQYFIVCEKLKTLHFAFYDPRIPAKDFFVIKVERKNVQEKVDECLAYERKVLDEVSGIVEKLTF